MRNPRHFPHSPYKTYRVGINPAMWPTEGGGDSSAGGRGLASASDFGGSIFNLNTSAEHGGKVKWVLFNREKNNTVLRADGQLRLGFPTCLSAFSAPLWQRFWSSCCWRAGGRKRKRWTTKVTISKWVNVLLREPSFVLPLAMQRHRLEETTIF